jgi:hypothetical protein
MNDQIVTGIVSGIVSGIVVAVVSGVLFVVLVPRLVRKLGKVDCELYWSCATLSRSMPSLAARIRRSRSLLPGETLTIAHLPKGTLTGQEHDLGVGAVQRKVPFVPPFRAVLKPYAIRTVVLTAGLAVLEPHLGLLYL